MVISKAFMDKEKTFVFIYNQYKNIFFEALINKMEDEYKNVENNLKCVFKDIFECLTIYNEYINNPKDIWFESVQYGKHINRIFWLAALETLNIVKIRMEAESDELMEYIEKCSSFDDNNDTINEKSNFTYVAFPGDKITSVISEGLCGEIYTHKTPELAQSFYRKNYITGFNLVLFVAEIDEKRFLEDNRFDGNDVPFVKIPAKYIKILPKESK